MPTYHIAGPVAIGLACSVSFTAGYAVNRTLGFERSAARQAIVEAQSFQRVMAAYQPIVLNQLTLAELEKITTLDQLAELRMKYRSSVVSAAHSFEQQAASLELPEEKAVARPFLNEAAKIKREMAAKQ